MLVTKYHSDNCENRELRVDIDRAVDSSIQLRSKKELIEGFIDSLTPDSSVDEDWRTLVDTQEKADLNVLIQEENLNPERTRQLVMNSFRDGVLHSTGTDIDAILPLLSRFAPQGAGRLEKKQAVLAKLQAFFEKFCGLISWKENDDITESAKIE